MRGRNQMLVLDALRRAGKPLGAYELLRLLQDEGLRSPLQIYRALERLLQRLARRQRFVTQSTTVELSGLCGTCADE